MIEVIKEILVVEAIIINCFLFLVYGLSGKLKEHTDYLFKKKKTSDINSGAKFG